MWTPRKAGTASTTKKGAFLNRTLRPQKKNFQEDQKEIQKKTLTLENDQIKIPFDESLLDEKQTQQDFELGDLED